MALEICREGRRTDERTRDVHNCETRSADGPSWHFDMRTPMKQHNVNDSCAGWVHRVDICDDATTRPVCVTMP